VIRAVAQNSEMADCLGADVARVRTLVFGAACALAGLGGVAAAPMTTAYLGMGISVIVDAFVVVVIGGLGSFWGVVYAALLVGVVRGLTVYFIPPASEASMYLLMLLVLLVRPRGLMGERMERLE
jgi:branched-chain amino acid transport system permease protein